MAILRKNREELVGQGASLRRWPCRTTLPSAGMSHVIHIWERPRPVAWGEADLIQGRLDGLAASPNPKFEQLAQRLLKAFPHRRDMNYHSPWIEGPPDGVMNDAIWALGIDSAQIDCVVPALIQQALALGLTVYDGQSGEAFVPGPWRLTPEGREPLTWSPVPPAALPQTQRDAGRLLLESRVRALVLPHVAPHGFRLEWTTGLPTHDSLDLQRTTPLGIQRVSMTPERWSERHWDFGLSIALEPRLPADLLEWCKPQETVPVMVRDWPTMEPFYRMPNVRRPYEAGFVCDGLEPLDRFLVLWADWIGRELLSVLDSCRDLDGFLRAGSSEEGVTVQGSAAGLAVAHCAGDPELATRALRYGQQTGRYGPRVDMFRKRLAELAGFPQHFGIYRTGA